MARYRIGLQTITFGEWQVENMPAVLEAAVQGGYDGVEIGYRRLGATTPSDLAGFLEDLCLSVAGIHAGGNLEDRAQASSERRVLDHVLEYARRTAAPFVMYSGLNVGDNNAALHMEIAVLNRVAQTCARHGIRLLYHNHNWEFAAGWLVMDALLRHADSSVGFCPDVGWVCKAGVEPVDFLNRIRGRVGAVHFKDFATLDNKVDTVPLGAGVVPFGSVVQWMADNVDGDGMWVIAEQDFADAPVPDTIRANAAYLKGVLD